jgi:hypothetical protein
MLTNRAERQTGCTRLHMFLFPLLPLPYSGQSQAFTKIARGERNKDLQIVPSQRLGLAPSQPRACFSHACLLCEWAFAFQGGKLHGGGRDYEGQWWSEGGNC